MVNSPVLVLNQNYEPLNVCRVRRAVILLFRGKAEVLENGRGSLHSVDDAFDIPSVMPDEAPELARMMTEQYKQVGVSIEIIEHGDRPAYAEMVREKKINDGCCFDSSPKSTYRVLREKIQSTLRGPWWQGYENEHVNDLIGRAEVTFSNTERQKTYRDIYTIIRNDAPWIFLYHPTRYWGVGPNLKNWKPRTDGLLIFFN